MKAFGLAKFRFCMLVIMTKLVFLTLQYLMVFPCVTMLYAPIIVVTKVGPVSPVGLLAVFGIVAFLTDFKNFHPGTYSAKFRHYLILIIVAPFWLFIRKYFLANE